MKHISVLRKTCSGLAGRWLLIVLFPVLVASCTAGDKGSERVPDSAGMDTTGNQNPTAVGEAGPSIPADTAAANNEPKPGAN